MKIEKSIYVSIAVIALNLLCLCVFHRVPVHRLWSGYETLAVSTSADENSVLNILKSYGCQSVVSLSFQNDSSVSQYSPVQKKNEFLDYNAKKNSFFFDKGHKYQVYYIPEKFAPAVEKAYSVLIKNYHVEAYLDSQVRFPWTTPLICFLFALFLAFFSKYKKVFLATAAFPLFFTLSQPFFVPSGAVCLLLFGLFLIQNIRRRKGFFAVVRNSIFTVFFFAFPVFFTFALSFMTGFLFFLCISSSVAAENLLYVFEEKRKGKLLFKSSLILPAQYIPLATHFNVRIMAGCVFVTVFFLIQFAFSSRFLPSSTAKNLLIPSPARYNMDSSIISLSDYIEWSWYTVTYPYRSLNSKFKKVETGDTVEIPRFEETGNGISRTTEVVFRFDNDFKQSVLKEIDSKPDSSMERLLKRQGNLNSAVYASAGTSSGDLHEFLILLVEFMVTPVVLIFLLVRTKKNDKD